MKLIRAFLGIAALWSLSLAAVEIHQFGITKVEDFVQMDDTAPIYVGAGSFSFYAYIDATDSNRITAATVKSPDGQTLTLTPDSSGQRWYFIDYFDNPVLLDLEYPPGSYRMEFTTTNDGLKAISILLPESFFPNTPRLRDWPAAQRIQADKPFELRWEPFAEGTAKDFVALAIYDFDGNELFDLDLDGTDVSAILPPETLEFGTEYRASLSFGRVAEGDHANFVRRTTFPLATAGTPDFPEVRFQLSFSYFAFGGDFLSSLSVTPPRPAVLDTCYVVRLRVENEEFIPPTSGVTFSSPPGTVATQLEAAYFYHETGGNGSFFESPCLFPSTNTAPGVWSIEYNQYPISFTVPDAKPTERLVIPMPIITLESNSLKQLDWSYGPAGTPSFITNQVVELFNDANLPIYLSTDLPSALGTLSFSNRVNWSEVRSMTIAYQDDLGNWYGISFDHSPPGDLEIVTESLPLGSLANLYSVRLIASNGVPPLRWSLEGSLPPGLKLDAASGVISGRPQKRGNFRFALRVDDQAKAFDWDQFLITVVTNGPPVILEPPRGGSVELGDYTLFEVTAEGTQPLHYQWFFQGQPLAGETNSTLPLINISTNQAGNYSVRIANVLGSITSEPARLVVRVPPLILSHPASQTAQAGGNVTFTVEVASNPPIFYQWRRNGEVIDGETNAFYTIPNAQPQDAGDYSVLVAGPEGLVLSEDATLRFTVETLTLTNRFANRVQFAARSGLARGSNGGANRDSGEPVHARVPGGSSVWITWVPPAGGIATFTTRGSTFDTLLAIYVGEDVTQLQEVVSDDDGAEFYASFVRFNARAGQPYQIAIDGVYGSQGDILLNWSLNTSGARLPEILRQPVDAIVAEGATATFSLLATNPPPATDALSYQWFFHGLPIPSATNDTLAIPNVTEANLGLYFAILANDTESIFSDLVVIEMNSSDGAVDRLVSTEDKFANVARQTNGVIAPQMLPRAPRPIAKGGSVARGFSGSQVFSTIGSSTEAGEPNHCGVVGGASQWFSYLAPTNGFLTIDTDGSEYDTVMTVYTGSELDFDSLQEIACDNDGGADGRDSRVAFPASTGTFYLIVVDGVLGASGTARLNYRLGLPPKLHATLVNQQVQLRLVGPPQSVLTIESSDNLVDWSPVLTTNSLTGTFDWIDRRTVNPAAQFYRSFQVD